MGVTRLILSTLSTFIILGSCGLVLPKTADVDPPYKERIAILEREAKRYFVVPGGVVVDRYSATKCIDPGFSPKTPETTLRVRAEGSATDLERLVRQTVDNSPWGLGHKVYIQLGVALPMILWQRDFGKWEAAASVIIWEGEYSIRLRADIQPNCPEREGRIDPGKARED